MGVYHDPGSTGDRPNLVDRLMSVPSSLHLEPMENQLTETLGWLLDRDHELARAFLLLFVDDEATVARIGAAGSFAARTQVHLPGAGLARMLRPDLSVTTGGRQVQLLVEVKPGAGGFHTYPVGGVSVPQPEAYAWVWAQRPPEGEAAHRWVGTLTRSSARDPILDTVLDGLTVRRARDVTWQQLLDLLDQRGGDELLHPAVRAVAEDFGTVLRDRVILADVLPPPSEVARLLERGDALLRAIRRPLSQAGFQPRRAVTRGPDYVGTYLDVPFRDGELELWVQISPRGGRYALREEPDSLIIVVKRKGRYPGSDWSEWFVPAGLRYGVDREGYRGYRHTVPVEKVWGSDTTNADAIQIATGVIEDLISRVRVGGAEEI